MRLNYFAGCKNLEEVKKRYKQLALTFHPDRKGGNEEIMKQINGEYEAITKDPYFKFSQASAEAQKDYQQYPEILSKIIRFDITIEICGNWIWLSGPTYRYRKQLKEIGFQYAHLKKMWYWRPNEYESQNQKPMPMDYIRRKYGSDVVETEVPEALQD